MPLSPFPSCPISASPYLAQQSNNEQRGLSQKPIPTCLFTTAASQYGLCCWVFLFKCLLTEEAWHSVEAVFDKAAVGKGPACITSHTHRTPACWQMNPESSLWKRSKSLYLYVAESQLAPLLHMLPSLNEVVNAVTSAKTPHSCPQNLPELTAQPSLPCKDSLDLLGSFEKAVCNQVSLLCLTCKDISLTAKQSRSRRGVCMSRGSSSGRLGGEQGVSQVTDGERKQRGSCSHESLWGYFTSWLQR